MIRGLVLIAFFLVSILSFSQNERWDSKNRVYSNFDYGVTFQMHGDSDWMKVTGNSLHTVFKMVEKLLDQF